MLNSQKDTDRERGKRRGTEIDSNLLKNYIFIDVYLFALKNLKG